MYNAHLYHSFVNGQSALFRGQAGSSSLVLLQHPVSPGRGVYSLCVPMEHVSLRQTGKRAAQQRASGPCAYCKAATHQVQGCPHDFL